MFMKPWQTHDVSGRPSYQEWICFPTNAFHTRLMHNCPSVLPELIETFKKTKAKTASKIQTRLLMRAPSVFHSVSKAKRLQQFSECVCVCVCVCVCLAPDGRQRNGHLRIIYPNSRCVHQLLHWECVQNRMKTQYILARALDCARSWSLTREVSFELYI